MLVAALRHRAWPCDRPEPSLALGQELLAAGALPAVGVSPTEETPRVEMMAPLAIVCLLPLALLLLGWALVVRQAGDLALWSGVALILIVAVIVVTVTPTSVNRDQLSPPETRVEPDGDRVAEPPPLSPTA